MAEVLESNDSGNNSLGIEGSDEGKIKLAELKFGCFTIGELAFENNYMRVIN